jgi:tRNA threonylcarbamoyladenosine biosynthesis protein TsaE
MTNAKPPCDGIVTPGSAECATPEATQALGARFAAALEPGAVLSLEGPLGAGKTQFVKGFVAALGHASEASSPTFTLVHEYAGGRAPAVHFDWYRLESADEAIGLGWDDYLLGREILLVEWGDKFPELLPAEAWRLRFEIQGTARVVRWERGA